MSPRLVSARTVTARVAHGCDTCNRLAAAPGEDYTRETYAYDGRVYDWVQCAPCLAISNLVSSWSYSDDVIGQDDYAEWANDHRDDPEHGEAARFYLARLIPAASNQGAHHEH